MKAAASLASMKKRKNKLFLKFIDRVMIAVLTLSLLVMPAESAVAAPEEEPKEPEAVADNHSMWADGRIKEIQLS